MVSLSTGREDNSTVVFPWVPGSLHRLISLRQPLLFPVQPAGVLLLPHPVLLVLPDYLVSFFAHVILFLSPHWMVVCLNNNNECPLNRRTHQKKVKQQLG